MGCLIKIDASKFIRNFLFVSMILLLVVFVFSMVPGFHLPVAVIASGSMSPTLQEGDVVVWTSVDIEDVNVGDLVVFKSYMGWSGERLVAHRVTEIEVDSGVFMLGTKGDACEWSDQDKPSLSEPYIRDDHLLGRVVSIENNPFKIPLVGYMGLCLNNNGVFTWLLISLVLSVLFVYIVYSRKPSVNLV